MSETPNYADRIAAEAGELDRVYAETLSQITAREVETIARRLRSLAGEMRDSAPPSPGDVTGPSGMRSLTPDEELQFQACVAKHYTEEPVARGDVTGTPAPDTRMFPLLDGPREIPWSVIAPFAGQAERNHGQTLANLAGRGGLSVKEALHVMLCVEWSRSKESARITALSDRDATLELTALVAKTSRPDLTGETPPAAAERVGKGPNGSHRCPVCGAFCVCAEWYDGAPCEHRVHSGCQSGGGPPPETTREAPNA